MREISWRFVTAGMVPNSTCMWISELLQGSILTQPTPFTSAKYAKWSLRSHMMLFVTMVDLVTKLSLINLVSKGLLLQGATFSIFYYLVDKECFGIFAPAAMQLLGM